ncbi:hypothetical protein G7Z17_g2385 [Cylindrodendrum hubeiense]|uniref:Uncharacterized protein n=1 Tax=Cylindrodendrum hubeiense TaxID=595255 RepID=A0A9P5HN78_9HYPO|nr:hypothetical protein G7Z17_g2385 [Cylindrodendrum hubeiense]
MTLNSDTVLASLVISNNLHCGYFIAIAVLECAGSFFLVRKFSSGKKAMKQAHLNSGLFHYIMRSTEFRLTLLTVIGMGRAITHLCNPSYRVITDLSSQIDRFFYTAECMFPIMIFIDILASRLIHSSLYESGSSSNHGVGRRSSAAHGYSRFKSAPQPQEVDPMPEFHHGEDSSGARIPRNHCSDGESAENILLMEPAVRANAAKVLEAADKGELNHFDYHPSRMSDVSDFVIGVIKRDFGPDKFDTIPPHGRWQHFEVGGVPRVDSLIAGWAEEGCKDKVEVTRRLIDLFFVAVLLDAGAGDHWRFKEPGTEEYYVRSEGIAVASLHMFKAGAFVSEGSKPHQVDAQGLSSLTEEEFNGYFQISPENPMVGVASRVRLINDVGASLVRLPDIFGESGRPGSMVDYLTKRASTPGTLDYEDLWSSLQRALIPSWPKDRTTIEGQPIGDAWPLDVLAKRAEKDNDKRPRNTIQPFHKLTQWLAYSLMVPFVRLLGFEWKNAGLGTGLPEYRNGGLFVDLKVLTLKEEVLAEGLKASGEALPKYDPASDVIVEWRAMTVALLDELHKVVSAKFAAEGVTLSMAQMLEAGSWKSGRELAAKFRPDTKSSPILDRGDGTLY